MKKQLIEPIAWVIAGLFVSVNLSVAQDISVTHVFNAGDPARASEVNRNFQDVVDGVNANRVSIEAATQVYDYRDYLAANNIVEKTFSVTAGYDSNTSVADLGDCIATSALWSYTHADDGAGTPVTSIVRTAQNESVICSQITLDQVSNIDYLTLIDSKFHDPADTASVLGTFVFSGGLKLLSRAMGLGAVFADSVARVQQEDGLVQIVSSRASFVRVEDVTVAYGSFTGCLVVSVVNQLESFEPNQYLDWQCPGVGTVKRISQGQFENGIYELTGMTIAP